MISLREQHLQLLATLATCSVIAIGLILGEGTLREKLTRTRSIALRWLAYSILDYGLMLLSIGLVAVSRAIGATFTATAAVMFVFDLLMAWMLWTICLRSGQDLTLGREYRRSTILLYGRSRLAGHAAFLLLLAKSVVWDGPERLVEYFHFELENRMAMAMGMLCAMALLQALFWTALYWGGLEVLSSHA